MALIQFAVLSSFIYQIFKEVRKPIDKDVENVKVSKSSTVVNQLEFDTMSRSKEGAVDVNELIANINEDEIRVLSYLLSRGR